MIISLMGEVNTDMLSVLIAAINTVKDKFIITSQGVSRELVIYFSSEGGEVDIAETMIDIINSNKELITIKFLGDIFSAGMLIFLKTICKKELINEARGMYHYSYQELPISEGGKPQDAHTKFALKEIKKSKNRTLEYLNTLPLLDIEINNIKKGKDVYFSYERLLEILNGGKAKSI